MGMNYYKKPKDEVKITNENEYELHIGKRSAAGFYCWDCNLTILGEARLCPMCHKSPVKEEISESAMGLELGFKKPNEEKPTGVRSVSSFNWAINPKEFEYYGENIVDECDRVISKEEFKKMLKNNCPIQFFHMIGEEFC